MRTDASYWISNRLLSRLWARLHVQLFHCVLSVWLLAWPRCGLIPHPLLTGRISFTDSLQGPHEERLIDDILVRRRYNRLARPVSRESDALEVKFGLALQQIIDVVRALHTLETGVKRTPLSTSFERDLFTLSTFIYKAFCIDKGAKCW